MEEILYQVCRDSEEYAKDMGDVVTIWPGEMTLHLTPEVVYPKQKYWEGEANTDPLFEMTSEEFSDSFYIDAPIYGEKFFIRTSCKWEKVT